jgi:hypothetical protein
LELLVLNISYNMTMTHKADGKRLLSESALCRLLGVDRNRRRVWAEQGQLRRRGRKRYGELDAAELAVFRRLVDEFDYDRAREAWQAVRPALRDSLWTRPLWVVLNEGRAEGRLVHDAQSLFEFAGRVGRFQIVEVAAGLEEALAGFRNATQAKLSTEAKKAANVQQLRKKSAK